MGEDPVDTQTESLEVKDPGLVPHLRLAEEKELLFCASTQQGDPMVFVLPSFGGNVLEDVGWIHGCLSLMPMDWIKLFISRFCPVRMAVLIIRFTSMMVLGLGDLGKAAAVLSKRDVWKFGSMI